MYSKFDDIVREINNSLNFIIFTHTNMDGDALGSSMALCRILRSLGKYAYILLEDSIPAYLNVISAGADFFVYEVPFANYTAIAVDCGDESRIEKRVSYFKNADLRLCIDHHIKKDDFAEYSVVESDAAATAVLIYELSQAMNMVLTKEMAEDLYVGLSTDTGSFMFHNADKRCMEIVAKLYEYNIDHANICMAIYSTVPVQQLKVEARALDNAEVFADGKAVISYITDAEIKELGCLYENVDSCIDKIRVIEGVEIACMIKQHEDGSFKVSFRSKYYADVNKVASALGGGGHMMASGCTLYCGLEEAKDILKAEIIKAL